VHYSNRSSSPVHTPAIYDDFDNDGTESFVGTPPANTLIWKRGIISERKLKLDAIVEFWYCFELYGSILKLYRLVCYEAQNLQRLTNECLIQLSSKVHATNFSVSPLMRLNPCTFR